MRGTEKQLAWAAEIQKTVISILREGAEHASEFVAAEDVEAVKAEAYRRITAIENADYAGDIIALFKSVRKTGNYVEDFLNLLFVYRISGSFSAGSKTILCK